MRDHDVTGVRAAVVGTGLIGGSVLLGLHAAGLDVVGWDPDPGTRQLARDRGLRYADDLAGAVRDRDLVFLCGPLVSLPETLAEVAGAAPEHCVLTDVGSTKAGIAAAARERGLANRFVPGHPMAGTERAGLAAAVPDLFHQAAWVLCPPAEGDPGRFRRLAQVIIEVFGARVVPMEPEQHDAAVALSSHLPHLLSRALAGTVARSPMRPAVVTLAAGSFRDGTRVAGTPSQRTADMLVDNRVAVLRELAEVETYLGELVAALRDGDAETLAGRLGMARDLRLALVDPPATGQTVRFPVSGPTADEHDFLVRLGARGGWLTDCVVAGDVVTYTAWQPD